MNDRRRGQRHLLTQPGMASVRVTQDVEVTHVDRSEATVIATRWLPAGERLLLEIADEERGGVSYLRLVRVVNTRFVLKDARLRREIRLSIIGRPQEVADMGDRLDAAPAGSTSMIGAIIRRVPVRLVEVSSSGCLWEAQAPLDEGSAGFVEVRTSGRHQTEAVRILRTSRAADSHWRYRMAVEFLTLRPLSPESLRGVATLVATGVPSAH